MMKLRTKYLLFVVMLHLLALVLSFYIFRENRVLFIISEAVIILSVGIAWSLYRQLVQPLKTLMTGLNAIRDQDYTVKFSPTGKVEVDQLIGVYNQMIDQLRRERTLQEQQHFFLQKLIEASPTGIIILNFDDEIQAANPRALQILGMNSAELTGQSIHRSNHILLAGMASLDKPGSKTVKSGGSDIFKVHKSHFIDRGFARHFILIEELTAEILAVEKNAYGKVIRMMAHEVNNTIGPVNSIIQSALSVATWTAKDDDLREALRIAMDRNQNLNLFIRNFSDLVKLPQPNKNLLDFGPIVQSILTLMNPLAEGKGVQLLAENLECPFLLEADEQQMEQVLINIIKNAVEATPAGGTVCAKLNADLCELVITDTGNGISAEISAQLFTPFFTTKRDGQGVGLALIREILNNHGFKFSLETAGEKTEFRIVFEQRR